MNVREAQDAKRISLSAVTPVNFRFQGNLAPTAARVALVGTFNGWNPRSHLLTKNLKDDWMITVYFPLRCRIVYHFEVDGVPWLDPDDDGRVPNGWGSEYSVRYIGRAIGPPGTC